jgi:hypothetical protein
MTTDGKPESAFCPAECQIREVHPLIPCALDVGHEHEHEANLTIEVNDVETWVLIWWGDDGHAFVGSNRAVDTGNING